MPLLGVLALSCARNPATGKQQLNLVPQKQEVALGKQAAQDVAQSIGHYQDAKLQTYVADLGQRLVAVSERKNLPWEFHVVDDASVNAFAIPGGYIYVTRGLLAHLNNEAQLASVVGHEIGHVTARHSVNQISKAQLAQLGLGVGMLLSDTVRQFSQLGMAGVQLMFLKFSRTAEHQADQLGLRYAYAANYDVRQMPAVFAQLGRVSESSKQGRLPEWLATHPDPEHRIENIQTRLAKLDLTHTRMAVDTEEYLRLIDGMHFGENPREGYFQGDRFMHPDMKFTMAFPPGWQKQNLKQGVVAVSPQQDAAIQVTMAKEASPLAAMRAFIAQQGVRVIDGAGNPAGTSGHFVATTEQGELGGLVAFVAHEGKTFQIVGFTAAERLAAYDPTFMQTASSFGPLTDPAALSVQPAQVRIQRASRAMTLADMYREHPASVPIETIALINQAETNQPLQPGQMVKWVTGGAQAK